MPPLTVIAKIKAQPGKEAIVRSALLKLIEPTRAEAGCINYDLHVAQDDPTVFYFHENWASAEELTSHLDSEHLRAGLAEMHGAFESVEIRKLDRIG